VSDPRRPDTGEPYAEPPAGQQHYGAAPGDAAPILQQPGADERPRRYNPIRKTETPTGYRSSKRGSKAAKEAKKAQRSEAVVETLDKATRTTRSVLWVTAWSIGVALVSIAVLLLLATGVNSLVRWNLKRIAAKNDTAGAAAQRARQNVLFVGVEGGKAVGFLATRVDDKGGQAFGVAIPDGAFIEVPGQGFERIGESFRAGSDISLSAVSNFLGVPFSRYAVVPGAAYQSAVKNQNLSALPGIATDSNMSAQEREKLANELMKITSKNTAIVPLPVKPISLGDQTYFEPQREEVADLIKSWWGVTFSGQGSAPRVIVFNGAGVPGIAGVAAQQLIRAGVRVVDTKNADRFNYAKTIIVIQQGPESTGATIRKVLGVGEIVKKPADQEVADVLVIIGKDYKPPTGGK
jgi:hypothetical protein